MIGREKWDWGNVFVGLFAGHPTFSFAHRDMKKYIPTLIWLIIITIFLFYSIPQKNNWRNEKINSSSTVCKTRTGAKYHRCYHYSTRNYPLSLFEADEKGYSPCNVCKPPIAPDYSKDPDKPTYLIDNWFFSCILITILFWLIYYVILTRLKPKKTNNSILITNERIEDGMDWWKNLENCWKKTFKGSILIESGLIDLKLALNENIEVSDIVERESIGQYNKVINDMKYNLENISSNTLNFILNSINEIWIINENINDINPLKKIKSLKKLIIENKKIDKLAPIYHLKSLEELEVIKSSISKKEILEFKSINKNCKIIFEGLLI